MSALSKVYNLTVVLSHCKKLLNVFPVTAYMIVYRSVVWVPDRDPLLFSQALPEDERPQRQQRLGLFLHNQTLLEGEVSASFLSVTVRRFIQRDPLIGFHDLHVSVRFTAVRIIQWLTPFSWVLHLFAVLNPILAPYFASSSFCS